MDGLLLRKELHEYRDVLLKVREADCDFQKWAAILEYDRDRQVVGLLARLAKVESRLRELSVEFERSVENQLNYTRSTLADYVHIYVSLASIPGYSANSAEELDAEPLGDALYRIVSPPVFVVGISMGDVVRVQLVGPEHEPWICAVATESNSWTIRVVPQGPHSLHAVARVFEELGCFSVSTGHGIVAVDVPERISLAELSVVLDKGVADKRWKYEVGCYPRMPDAAGT